MKIRYLFVLSAMISAHAHAADPKVYCQFQSPVANSSSGSSYATEYILKGTLGKTLGRMGVKRTEYGVVKVGSKWTVNRADVRNPNTVDVPSRNWVLSTKNTGTEWRTYAIQHAVNDGYIARASVTISNQRISDPMYSDSYKAIFSITTMGDESNYTQKVYGICAFEN